VVSTFETAHALMSRQASEPMRVALKRSDGVGRRREKA
jgi:hypothetical protein